MRGEFTILYGQIVDYSQLNKSYGEHIEEINSRYKLLIESSAEKYNGELIQNTVDSLKIIFKNPENALQFAIDIFSKFSLEPRIPYRVSINYGLIEYSSDNISGEPSNITAQLLEICSEGAVLITEEVKNQVSDQGKFNIRHIGSTLLKGANGPITLFCIAEDGLYVPTQMELTVKSREKISVAVLPFNNTSSEKELDYICEGIAEEVIDALTKVKDIFVTARSSSFMFRKQDAAILEISRKLNVGYVLDGSIRKRKDEYRIFYQLVDCATGYNIISDTISSDFDSLYDSEGKITKSITRYFNEDEPEINIKQNEDYYIDPRAYSYYLQGKYFSNQWDADNSQAIKLFNKALEIIPDYALAYAGISLSYTHMALNGQADFKDSITNAVVNADKAIEADNSIPDGYLSKALATFWMGNWYVPDFEKNITSALEISPCNAEIRMFNGMMYLAKGELKKSLIELKLAKELDPYSQGINLRLGLCQYLNREYADAHNTFLGLLETQYNKTYNVLRLAWCCIMLEQYNKALDYLDESTENYEYYNMIYGTYLVIYKGLKDDTSFFKYKSIIERLPKDDASTNYNLAVLNKILGKPEQSIHYLEKMLQNPLFYFMFLQYDEFWEEFHEHPLFIRLIASKYKGTDNQLIRIDSETKEYIEIKYSNFLYAEAQDNYTLIVFKENSKPANRILRATLSHIENQLKDTDIYRCHRSYLVNLNADFYFHKDVHKAVLKHHQFDISVPVSRSKEKEIKELTAKK